MKKMLLIIDCQKAFINNYTKEYVNQWNTTCVETYFAQEFYTK